MSSPANMNTPFALPGEALFSPREEHRDDYVGAISRSNLGVGRVHFMTFSMTTGQGPL